MGTLTSSNSNSVRISRSPINVYKLCAMATPEYSGPLLPSKLCSHRRLRVGFTKSLFYRATRFLHHSTNIKAGTSVKLIQRPYPDPRVYRNAVKSLSALCVLWSADLSEFATRRSKLFLINCETTPRVSSQHYNEF